jgi:hypothetical protein
MGENPYPRDTGEAKLVGDFAGHDESCQYGMQGHLRLEPVGAAREPPSSSCLINRCNRLILRDDVRSG